MPHPDDTIVAVATAWAPSSIGVIRVSGPQAREIVERITHRSLRDWGICRARIHDPISETIIDDAIVSYMAGPRSYTGEDVVEVSAHGSLPILRQIQNILVREGARQAGPGEFSQRAYLNGKLDLPQVESILSIIEAKTEAGARAAASQLFGSLSIKILQISEKLRNLLADIEASVDYPEDVGGHEDAWIAQLRDISQSIGTVFESAKLGEIMRSGISIAIVGPPNAGKSSLLNRLLSQNRAIVSDEPGTTRDVLIETVSIHGIPCEVIDTAGIRAHASHVESQGIERSHDAIRNSDFVIVTLDATSNISFFINEYCGYVGDKPALFLLNKSDLLSQEEADKVAGELPPNGVMISVKENSGLDHVLQLLYQMVLGNSMEVGTGYFLNEQQKYSLAGAFKSVSSAVDRMALDRPVEAAIDVRLGIQSLDEINGAVLSDDIIGRVFSRFCVGK